MRSEEKETFDKQNWVPWIGLALVLPAVIILLVGAFSVALNTGQTPAGDIGMGDSRLASGIAGGVIVAIGALGGLMLALVGLIRGLRRPAPHTGRSVGLAGFTLEIGTIVIAAVALAALALRFL